MQIIWNRGKEGDFPRWIRQWKEVKKVCKLLSYSICYARQSTDCPMNGLYSLYNVVGMEHGPDQN